MSPPRAEIVVDLAAIRHNVQVLRERAGVPLIAVVKADGYGHGMVQVARAAREAGADWIACATLDEVRRLRASGDTGRLLTWLTVPEEHYDDLIEADVDLTAYSVEELEEMAAAARLVGTSGRVQLKVDTGLNRGGAPRSQWEALFARARQGELDGHWRITGLWSHLACADEPDHPANAAQEHAFREAIWMAERGGLRPVIRHLNNSAGTLTRPSSMFDAVRCGIAVYGLDPAPGVAHGADLRQAMTVRARLAMVKHLEPGDSVSYGHLWTADRATTVGLIPVGYADGVPRSAGTFEEVDVAIGGRLRPIRGRVCMDQFVVDLDGDTPPEGTEAVLFGRAEGPLGPQPTAQDWAEACGTINYEIVTRVGGRMVRTYVDSDPLRASGSQA